MDRSYSRRAPQEDRRGAGSNQKSGSQEVRKSGSQEVRKKPKIQRKALLQIQHSTFKIQNSKNVPHHRLRRLHRRPHHRACPRGRTRVRRSRQPQRLLRLLISDQGQRTKDRGPRTADQGPRTEDRGPRTADSGPTTPLISASQHFKKMCPASLVSAHRSTCHGIAQRRRTAQRHPTKDRRPRTKNERRTSNPES